MSLKNIIRRKGIQIGFTGKQCLEFPLRSINRKIYQNIFCDNLLQRLNIYQILFGFIDCLQNVTDSRAIRGGPVIVSHEYNKNISLIVYKANITTKGYTSILPLQN